MGDEHNSDARRNKPGTGAKALRPTIIGAPPGKPQGQQIKTGSQLPSASSAATKAASPAAASPAAIKPTAIPGVERKRIEVDLAGLKELSPTTRGAVLERARELVESFAVGGTSDRQAVLWGHRLQQDYSNIVSRTLELSQAAVLKRVAGYIGRMTDILGSIDLEAVARPGAASGVVGGFLRKMNVKIDSPEELELARTELDQLVQLMGDSLEELLSLKETLARQASQIVALGEEIDASALAALFASEHLREIQPALAQRYLERSMSLSQTLAQIRGNSSLRDVQIEQPLRLIGAIQNVALVMVPGWLGSIAALGTMLESKRKVTPTQTGELAYQLRNIVQQLKP